MKTRWHVVCAAFLMLALAFQLSPIVNASFVYEDDHWMSGCEEGHDFWAREITRWTWCEQVRLNQSARAFHIVNIAFYFCVIALVACLVWRMTDSAVATWTAIILWSLHPLNMETAAYLSSRSELIAAVGVIGACVAVMYGHWTIAAMAVAVGILGKESAIVALALAPFIAWVKDGRRQVIALGGIVSAFALILLVVTMTHLWWQAKPFDIVAWPMIQVTALGHLIALSVVPWGQSVSYDYAHVPVLVQVMSCVAIGTFALCAWSMRHTDRLISGGMLWIILASIPRLLVLTPNSVMNEHQFFVPLMGFAFVVAGISKHFTEGPCHV